jgi:hypothetical protein
MRTRILIFFFFTLLYVAVASPAQAQTTTKKRMVVVTLKDGKLVKGALLSIGDSQLEVENEGGVTNVIMEAVTNIAFTEGEAISKPQPSASPSAAAVISPESRQAAIEALRSFHKLLSAEEVGTSYVQYNSLVIDTKVAVEESLGSIQPGYVKTDIEQALDDFVIAAQVWNTGIQNNGIPTKTDLYRSLNERYRLGVNPRMGLTIDHLKIIKIIWRVAGERLEQAASLLQ